jgi:hypothetical protein
MEEGVGRVSYGKGRGEDFAYQANLRAEKASVESFQKEKPALKQQVQADFPNGSHYAESIVSTVR